MNFEFKDKYDSNSVAQSIKYIKKNFSDETKQYQVSKELNFIDFKLNGRPISVPAIASYYSSNITYLIRSDQADRVVNMVRPIIDYLADSVIRPEVDARGKISDKQIDTLSLLLLHNLLDNSDLKDPRRTSYDMHYPLKTGDTTNAIVLSDKTVIDVKYSKYNSTYEFKNTEHCLSLHSSIENHKDKLKKWAISQQEVLKEHLDLFRKSREFFPDTIKSLIENYETGTEEFLTSLIEYCDHGE